MDNLEQRINDLERRFRPIEYVLYRSEFKELIEDAKGQELNSNGYTFIVTIHFVTNVSEYTKSFEVKAYTNKQAEYLCERDIMNPNMLKLKEMGKIRWWKILSKKSTIKK